MKEEHLDLARGKRSGMLVVVEVDLLDPLEVPQDVHLGIDMGDKKYGRGQLTNLEMRNSTNSNLL